MHFVEGNHYCPSCETSGECELQALGYYTEMLTPTLPYLRPQYRWTRSHPDIYIDRDRCVLCGRCIRASEFLDGKMRLFLRRARHPQDRSRSTRCIISARPIWPSPTGRRRSAPRGRFVVKRAGYRMPVGKRRFDMHPIGWEIEGKKKSG